MKQLPKSLTGWNWLPYLLVYLYTQLHNFSLLVFPTIIRVWNTRLHYVFNSSYLFTKYTSAANLTQPQLVEYYYKNVVTIEILFILFRGNGDSVVYFMKLEVWSLPLKFGKINNFHKFVQIYKYF